MSSSIDWLKQKIEKLREFTDKLCKISNVHYQAHSWTPLKLLTLMYWVDVYTRIIPKQPKYCSNYWYLDLLAGSGTNYIKETGDIIIGSPFIALFFARQPFTRYIFIEIDNERSLALRKRVRAMGLANRVTVYTHDCNLIIPNMNITAKHYLAFIDCEGFRCQLENSRGPS